MDKENIKKILRETSEEKKEKKEKTAGTSAQYKRIYSLLQNNIFNHAEIVEKLWGDRGATNRSKFRKKLNREKSESGATYEFDEEELNKIASILMDTSSVIDKNLGKKVRNK